MKKRLSIVLAFAMAVSMMGGCKGADTAQSASGQTSATKEGGTKASENKETEKEQQASEQPGEKVHLKWAVKASEAGRAEFEEMAAMAEEACNVDIEIIALPDPGAGEANKLLISLMAVITPSATTIVQLAQLYDREPVYASTINVMTTLVSIVTMPLMVMFYLA